MTAKEKPKELKSLFALIALFEEQQDKDIKLMNAFQSPSVLEGIEKDIAKHLLNLPRNEMKDSP